MPRLVLAATAALALTALALVAAPSLVVADDGDEAGWSVATDPRKRAFLQWVPRANGPRVLLFACLRDADSFVVYSTGVAGLPPRAERVALVLRADGRTWSVDGSIDPDSTSGTSTYSSEWNDDDGARRRAARDLAPLLRGGGPLVLTIGGAPEVAIPLGAGIAAPLKTFERICFGK
ncbi:MAG: hypothetical protein ABTQ29_06045 [Siculibacillus sp.]